MLGQRDFHVHYAFWHVEQAYSEILSNELFQDSGAMNSD